MNLKLINNTPQWLSSPPCNIGDTIYFVNKMDCADCEELGFDGDCPDYACNAVLSDDIDDSCCPHEVLQQEVESLEHFLSADESYLTINDCYVFYDMQRIHKDEQAAQLELMKMQEGNKNADTC